MKPPVRRILVSACLLGENVRYDGGNLFQNHPLMTRWRAEGRIVPMCPEVAGGLPIPRPPAESREGDGHAVLAGSAHMITRQGEDVTEAFIAGANAALRTAIAQNCVMAVLAAHSPSCGNHDIYDGSFSGALIAGQGTAAACLVQAGIPVFNQFELEAAEAHLQSC